MKTLEKVKVLLFASLVVVAGASITACGGDGGYDAEDTGFPDDDGDDSGNSGGTGGSSSTYDILKRNISASASYSDYGWNISIKSNLADVFPAKTIIYGVESGYGTYKYYEHFTFKNEYLQNDDGKGNMSVSYPVFVGDEYALEMMYWPSYKALKNKKAHGETLTSDERDLWNDIVKDLNANEYKAKSSFCGRLYAQFDNTRYVFYTFGQEPSSGDTGGSGSGNTGSGGSGGSGGSSTTYEKPEIGLEDYTCYTTSITVKYRIYNQDKAKVTSAKGYYGTSSASISTSASVAGSLIIIRITGLKKGTTYYVKCSATGKGGTTTSDVTKLITDYY